MHACIFMLGLPAIGLHCFRVAFEVYVRHPRRPRLEAFMRPEIFGWSFQHARLDESVHASSGADDIVARIALPWRKIPHLPAAITRQKGGYYRHNFCAG